MRVAITGAEGQVGTVLRHGLAHSVELRALTRTPQRYDSEVADVTDLDSLVHAFRDCDAVIHLAAAAGLDAQWHDVLNSNIVGTRNVYEAARMMKVQTVVFASSGHVTGLLEERAAPALYSLQDARVFDEQTPAAPDSLYAVSKLYGETLGRLYAENHDVRVICVRLGAVLAG